MTARFNRLLITGTSGFVGGSVLQQATNQQWAQHIRILSTDSRHPSNSIEVIKYRHSWTPELIDNALSETDILINCAGKIGNWNLNFDDYHQANVATIKLLLNSPKISKLKKIIHISSPAVFGPLEKDSPPANETSFFNPQNTYEFTKTAGEKLISLHAKLPITIVRPEFIYGPGDLHVLRLFRSISKGRFAIIGSGNTLLHPTYIGDVISAIKLAIAVPSSNLQDFLIAGPKSLTVNQLVDQIRQVFSGPQPIHLPINAARALSKLFSYSHIINLQPPINHEQINFFTQNRFFDTTKAQKLLKYKPKTSFLNGLKQTKIWYQKNNLI